jgi:hypothetical protein
MKGTVWGVAATAIGVGVVLYGAVGRSVPSSAAPATQTAGDILTQVVPFVGLFLTLGVIGALLSLVFNI